MQYIGVGTDACVADFLFFHDEPADAAGGIAAGIDFGTIGVVDAHKHVGAFGGFEHDELVAAVGDRVGARGNGAHLIGGQA